MDENNNVNENVQNNVENPTAGTIEVPQPSGLKKGLKWLIGGLVVVGTFISGIFTGKALSKDDDDNDSSVSEGPKDE